jgi:hypothetical protein
MGNGNPVSGHTNKNLTVTTATNADGLTDGEHIISPTLTNMIEGVHGNGIMMYDDTSVGEGDRNTPANLPGAVNYASGTTFTVKGGYAVLDGVMYQFAGGVGATTTYTLNTSSASNSHNSGPSNLTSGQEALVVVYVCADDHTDVKHIYWELGTPTTVGTNNYPASPKSFLDNPSRNVSSSYTALANKQTLVLAVLRVVHDAGGDNIQLAITEVNDKRVFIRPSPMYFSPVTSGDITSTDSIESHTKLDNFHSGEVGGLTGSRFGAMWQSFGAQIASTTAGDNDKDVLYYSGTHAARFTRSVFDRVLTTALTTLVIKSTDANILILTARSGTCGITTNGAFPAGYIVEILNQDTGDTATFAGATIAASGYGRFVCTVSGNSPTFVRLV